MRLRGHVNNGRRSKRWALWHQRRLYNQANALTRRGLNFLFYMRETRIHWVSRRLNHKLHFMRRYFASTAVLDRVYQKANAGS